MKKQRRKAARHIFEQCKKAKSIAPDAICNNEVVDVSDITDHEEYYGGFIFVLSVAKHFCLTDRTTCAADAAHCDGVRPQSYVTTFEVVGYDTTKPLFPLAFGHSLGPEFLETWIPMFSACADIEGFDVSFRTTVVDQEKAIDRAYR